MYIHFDFDSWAPWLMARDLEKGIWHITKMVPPGKSHYFFSAGGVAARGSIASDHLFVKRARPKFIKRVECSELEGDPAKVVKYNMNFTLYRLNFMVTAPGTCLNPVSWEPHPQISCQPRGIRMY